MAKTVTTSSTSYLSAAEFLKRTDARLVGQLCADTTTPVSPVDLPADPNLAAALLDASGLVEAACLQGGRYTPADLAALTGAGRAYLYRILTRLTVALLWERRADRMGQAPAPAMQADQDLELLAQGHRILSFEEAQEAGLPHATKETAADVEDRDMATLHAQRYFGRRGNRRG